MDQIVLVHLSDLHFGERIDNHRFREFRGLQSHDIRLCEALADDLAQVSRRRSLPDDWRLPVVVSGDLTRAGSRKEYIVAHTFLRSAWWLRHSPTSSIGLNLAKQGRLMTIPGNHDHCLVPQHRCTIGGRMVNSLVCHKVRSPLMIHQ